jgi:hypothetical protein
MFLDGGRFKQFSYQFFLLFGKNAFIIKFFWFWVFWNFSWGAFGYYVTLFGVGDRLSQTFKALRGRKMRCLKNMEIENCFEDFKGH